VAQGTSASASARNEQPGGRGERAPDELRDSIDQMRTHAGRLREALAGLRPAEGAPGPGGPEPPDAVPVPVSLIDEIDEQITRVREEIAELKTQIGGPREALPEERDEACMVALNMALNGASPAETERYLEEGLGLRDRRRIVDDAYERVRRLRGS
jgi:hypothetical protein